MGRGRREIKTGARELLVAAQDYLWAADALLKVAQEDAQDAFRKMDNPAIHFLFCHTAELCLKAAIRAHGGTVMDEHDLPELHRQAVCQGFSYQECGVHYTTINTLNALQAGNASHALRYDYRGSHVRLNALLVVAVVRNLYNAAEVAVLQLSSPLKLPSRMIIVLPPIFSSH